MAKTKAESASTANRDPYKTIVRVMFMEEYPRNRKSLKRNGGKPGERKFKKTKTITVYKGTFTEVFNRMVAAIDEDSTVKALAIAKAK